MSLPVNEVDPSLELNSAQSSLLVEFKQWVEEKADFYGNSEQDFLVLFLRSCNFDLELSKKTLRLYYKARLRNPEWWTERNLDLPQLQFLIKANFGPDSTIVGCGGKYFTCGFEMAARRTNCQLNGAIVIINFENLFWWMVRQALWPPFLLNILNTTLYCLPFQVHMIVLVNAPSIASAAVNILRSFVPEEHKKKIQCCKSWSDIGQFVPLKVLPDEYGGNAGPLKVHEDATVNDMLALKDYFLDDNKYGFQVL